MRIRLLASLFVIACGGQQTVPPSTPVPGNNPGSSGSSGGTVPAAQTIDYTFSFGDPQIAVSAKVLDSTSGSITITDYPLETTSRIRLAPITVGFGNFFDSGYCDDVRQQAEQARSDNFALQQLRSSGGVPIHVTVSPLIGGAFVKAASDGARLAGASGSAFQLSNPLSVSTARLGVSVATDALVNIVGADDLVAALIEIFNGSVATSIANDDFAVQVAAKDLLCDLKSGKVTLEIDLGGQAGDATWSGKTFSGGVVSF